MESPLCPSSSASVTVSRAYLDEVYARISTMRPSQARPFVLIPGMGVSATYFERLAGHLGEHGPVHSLDLPGFGGVPHPEKRMSIRQYADLVECALASLGLDDPVIVAHSMRTQIAVDLAAPRPDLTSLVLIGPVVNAFERSTLRQAWRFLQSARREKLRMKVLSVSGYLICGFKWFSRVLPEMMQYQIERELPKVQADTLVVFGRDDRNCPRTWATSVAHLVPRAQAWEVPDAAYSVVLAHASGIARLCVEHASRVVFPAENTGVQQLLTSEPLETRQRSWSLVVASLRGRGTELIGILRQDDVRIARGKSIHICGVSTLDY